MNMGNSTNFLCAIKMNFIFHTWDVMDVILPIDYSWQWFVLEIVINHSDYHPINLDPEHHQIVVVSLIFQPLGRHINLLEGNTGEEWLNTC